MQNSESKKVEIPPTLPPLSSYRVPRRNIFERKPKHDTQGVVISQLPVKQPIPTVAEDPELSIEHEIDLESHDESEEMESTLSQEEITQLASQAEEAVSVPILCPIHASEMFLVDVPNRNCFACFNGCLFFSG
ncbi:hypothetical protein RCL1_000425 [Eukaryota sp. TZLM3-RCL]